MADLAARIEQFKKMAEADPNNELGHFSLGRALLEASRFDEAAHSFERALGLNANLSKGYQLLASALLKLDKRDHAIAQLQTGVKVADARGDLMPKNEMIRMLKELGAEIPVSQKAADDRPAGDGEVTCSRCGQIKPKLPKPPFSHEQGRLIFEKVCRDCWKEWIGMGTKVINELRLPLADPQAQKVYDQHMLEFLNLK
jgi:Fe-S cluster biosynthesis and repair protein YggX